MLERALAVVTAFLLFALVALVFVNRELRSELAEHKAAYQVLAHSVKTQNDSILEAERKAAEAARRGAQARAEAAGAVVVAKRSAEALTRVLGAPRAPGPCPSVDALEVVRADLADR